MNRNRHIGIMGGTFDPIHVGHLLAANTALDACALDEVWFIPTNVPPLKEGVQGAAAELRLRLVRLAIADEPRFKAVAIELARGGVSYSIDTVRELESRNPDCSFYYIIGSDRIHDLPQWHRIEELASMVRFIGVERPGEPIDLNRLPDWLRSRVELVSMPQVGISSTDIRSRRQAGRSIRYMVTEPVYSEIVKEGLYES
ncbi:nicotinate-nucleotide adenylyltransferase [Paenibacillus xylaniclasticus]|uniref:nicotinate-nucleotide adenylyltransferase n=1 Tax=Paenibacillus xylaniclasticus TaxID=588083 RepID=UPI000FDAB212|nr:MULTISPECIES: nicotinate-nucleotide adenylyltransferase [Paenibacillus]GFN30290.1 putative nicotinate-nucleotide adenylyltransferase [Paenibacillus curdlanolyticus]